MVVNVEEPIEAVTQDGQPVLVLFVEKGIALVITADGGLEYRDISELTTNRFFNDLTGAWDRSPYQSVAEEEPTPKPARRRKSAKPPGPPVVSDPVAGYLDASKG